MEFTEDQKQKIINACYYIGLACEELQTVNGLASQGLAGFAGALLNQVDQNGDSYVIEPIDNIEQPKISEEVKELINEFADDENF